MSSTKRRRQHVMDDLIGFLYDLYINVDFSNGDCYDDISIGGFVPMTTTSPLNPPALSCSSWMTVDSRHDRVLIHTSEPMDGLVVWVSGTLSTATRSRCHLQEYPQAHGAMAMLCAVTDCDHLDCSCGPFHVVFVGTKKNSDTWANLYSSDTSTWSPRTTRRRQMLITKRRMQDGRYAGSLSWMWTDPNL
jgi:hypothetical protein